MTCVVTRTQSGDVFFLNANNILVYDSTGIGLRLNQRNIAQLKRAQTSDQPIRDVDVKDVRFMVAWEKATQEFVFTPNKGEMIRSPEWLFFEAEKVAA